MPTDPGLTPIDAQPCPFCGGRPASRIFGHVNYVECMDCHAASMGVPGLANAIERWNRRAYLKPRS